MTVSCLSVNPETDKMTYLLQYYKMKTKSKLVHLIYFIIKVVELDIKSQIPLLKSKREINITNRQKTMRTYGQQSGQLFPKRWPLSNPNRTKSIMNKHKVKHHRNSDTKTGNRYHTRTTVLERSVMNYRGGGGLNMFYVCNLTLRN